jgi:hypothetical protein
MTWREAYLFYAVIFCWFQLLRLTASKEQKRLTGELVRHSDKRIIGPLLMAHSWPDMWEHRNAFRHALLTLLPTLRASDAALLSASHREQLNKLLRSRDVEYVHAALKALEQVGDESAIPYLERLIKSRSRTATQKQVQEAVKQCMAAVMQRTESGAPGSTLLRPTEGNPTETLLRPISNQTGAEEQNLLRPADSETKGVESDQPKD